MKALVYVALKPGVLDPQGRTIARSLNDLGFGEVESALQGKVIELNLTGDDANAAEARVKEKLNLTGDDANAAEARVKEMCEKLLARAQAFDHLAP